MAFWALFKAFGSGQCFTYSEGPSTQHLRSLARKTIRHFGHYAAREREREWYLGPESLNIGYLDPLGYLGPAMSVLWNLKRGRGAPQPFAALRGLLGGRSFLAWVGSKHVQPPHVPPLKALWSPVDCQIGNLGSFKGPLFRKVSQIMLRILV